MLRVVASILATVGFAVSGFVVAGPAEAQVSADCTVGLTQNSVGQSRPVISCLTVTGGEARGKADCVAAPDTNTAWVRSYENSAGGYCLFGARGPVLETRPG